jgi:hypothetical protein
MKITFYGAARTTTGSMHLIETAHQRILLDCGLYQGKRAEAFARNAHLPFDPRPLLTLFFRTRILITPAICRRWSSTAIAAKSVAPPRRAIWQC